MVSPSQLLYQDRDGDAVTVTFSKPILDIDNVGAVFTFDQGAVDGAAETKQQLRKINLQALGAPAAGTAITVRATRSAANGGDGFAAIGEIDATTLDLGRVLVDGDLGRIAAGDATPATPGLRGLTAQSMGRFGTTTGAPSPYSVISGSLDFLRIKGDVYAVSFAVEGGANGRIGSVVVGGSVIGGMFSATGQIFSEGQMGFATIRGDIVGGSGWFSGQVLSNTGITGLKVGGSLIGGTGGFSGHVSAGFCGSITIGGNIVGGSASGVDNLSSCGYLYAANIKSLTVGGSLIAGFDNTSGVYTNNGAIRVQNSLAKLLIRGSVIGNETNPAVISAYGQAVPAANSDIAIGSLRILGRVEHAQILAGVYPNGSVGNADAQIGSVTVGGDWIASSVAAGAVSGNGYFGDSADAVMSGQSVRDRPGITSRIGSLSIGGQVMGTVGGADHFGIVAQEVGLIKFGDLAVPVTIGRSNDEFYLGITGDFAVNEV
jgi:hypothetical protein